MLRCPTLAGNMRLNAEGVVLARDGSSGIPHIPAGRMRCCGTTAHCTAGPSYSALLNPILIVLWCLVARSIRMRQGQRSQEAISASEERSGTHRYFSCQRHVISRRSALDSSGLAWLRFDNGLFGYPWMRDATAKTTRRHAFRWRSAADQRLEE